MNTSTPTKQESLIAALVITCIALLIGGLLSILDGNFITFLVCLTFILGVWLGRSIAIPLR